MELELISKKDLLKRYSISYGALYRWKRMGLIPEEWFIKKTTVTGQETFFPVHLISERMELIQRQKDDCSLSELAKQLGRASEKKAVLIIRSVFGEKTFYLNEIQSIVVDHGDGTKEDLTSNILQNIKDT